MKSLVSAVLPSLAAAGLLIAFGLAGASPAAAQNYPQPDAEQACSNDAYRLCEKFIPDRSKTGACLRRNKRQLSPECAVFFGSRKLRRR